MSFPAKPGGSNQQSKIDHRQSLHSLDVHALPQIPAGDAAVGHPGFRDLFHLVGPGQDDLAFAIFLTFESISPLVEIVLVHGHADSELPRSPAN